MSKYESVLRPDDNFNVSYKNWAYYLNLKTGIRKMIFKFVGNV